MRAVRFPPVRRRVLRDEVISSIERAVLGGNLKPGDKLVETEMARQMGISRGPIREAIRELVGQGLLVSYPNRGASIVRWSAEDVREIYELRGILDGMAARLATENLTPGDIEQLQAIVDEMRVSVRDGNYQRFFQRDIEYHSLLHRKSGHKHLQDLLAALYVKMRLLMAIDITLTWPGVVHQQVVEPEHHQAILDALRREGPDLVEQTVRQWARVVGEAMVEKMRQESLLSANSPSAAEGAAPQGRPQPVLTGERRGGIRDYSGHSR